MTNCVPKSPLQKSTSPFRYFYQVCAVLRRSHNWQKSHDMFVSAGIFSKVNHVDSNIEWKRVVFHLFCFVLFCFSCYMNVAFAIST